MSRAEYALLQQKYLRENLLKEVSSHRSRAREAKGYLLATRRGTLEQQRDNLRTGLARVPLSIRRYYMDRILDLTRRIEDTEKKMATFK